MENKLKVLRMEMGLNRKEFAEVFGIPIRTVEDWETDRRKMPEYLYRLMAYVIRIGNIQAEKRQETEKRDICIINDEEGKKIVLINDI